jgi:hypothetical protein
MSGSPWEKPRIAKGLTSTKDNRDHFDGYIRPAFAGKPMRDWTSADCRAFVASLDAKIEADEISHKYAGNIYGTASKMCADACKSKIEALRLRTDNPMNEVEGFESGEERSKAFLYPSEFLRTWTSSTVRSTSTKRSSVAPGRSKAPRAGRGAGSR